MIEKAPSSSAQHRSTKDLPAPFPHVMLTPKMTEPAGLATHITLSPESFQAAVEGPLGLAAAELFQKSQSDDRVLALFYSKPTKGVFVCACDAAGRTSAWLTKEVMKLCKELAGAKTDGEKDLLIMSDSFMNYREDPISDSYELGATRASRLKKAPSWSDPRLAVLDRLLQKRFFPKLEKLEKSRANMTREELEAARQELAQKKDLLAAQQADLNKTAAELEAERKMRVDAEKKLSAALTSLSEIGNIKEEKRGVVITLSGSVLFASGKYTLLPIAKEKLNEVAKALKDQGYKKIIVEGHTDSRGTEANNESLSLKRANSVRSHLVSQGIEDAKISAIGLGEARPIATNDTPDGRANNRRVELVVTPE